MNGVVPLAATAITTSLTATLCWRIKSYGLLGLVLGAFDRVQQRILAAGHQQQQAILRPAEGRHQLGAVLDRKPAGRSGARIDQAAALFEPRFDGSGGALNRRADGAHGRYGRELPLDHGVQDVGRVPNVDVRNTGGWRVRFPWQPVIPMNRHENQSVTRVCHTG